MPRIADGPPARDLVAAKNVCGCCPIAPCPRRLIGLPSFATQKNAGAIFRKQVAARAKLDKDRTSVNRYTETWGDGTQYVCELVKRSSDGEFGLVEYEGLVKHIPRIGRAKRTADALDEEDEDPVVQGQEIAQLWDDQVRGRTTARVIKKKRTSTAAASAAPRNSTAPRPTRTGAAVPTRRSTRTATVSSRARQHSTIPEEGPGNEFQGEQPCRRPTFKDEDQDISDLMNQFEIHSNAGTGKLHLHISM